MLNEIPHCRTGSCINLLTKNLLVISNVQLILLLEECNIDMNEVLNLEIVNISKRKTWLHLSLNAKSNLYVLSAPHERPSKVRTMTR